MLSSEYRYRFNVRRMRKHVHHSRCIQAITVLVDEYTEVTRERARMTGNIDDSVRRESRHMIYYRGGTGARRVEQDAIVST